MTNDEIKKLDEELRNAFFAADLHVNKPGTMLSDASVLLIAQKFVELCGPAICSKHKTVHRTITCHLCYPGLRTLIPEGEPK